jgi:hypothetical protein
MRGRDQRDAAEQPGDLRQRLARAQPLLQLRDQVGERDVDEAAAGHHQEVRQVATRRSTSHQPTSPPSGVTAPASDTFTSAHARAAALPAQHGEVADVVRHLVRQHRQRGDQAQVDVGGEGRGDQDAVAEAVHAVAGEHGPAAAARARARAPCACACECAWPHGACPCASRLFAAVVVLMAVVPQLRLVQEERRTPGRPAASRTAPWRRVAFHRFRQQVHEGGGQQRAGGQAQQVLLLQPRTRGCGPQPRRIRPAAARRCRCRRRKWRTG